MSNGKDSVVVVAIRAHAGLPDTILEFGMIPAIQKNQFNVIPFYIDSYLGNLPELQDALINFAESRKPKFIFFLTYGEQYAEKTLTYLKSKWITIGWFGDDTWRFQSYTKRYANMFTYCITTDKFSLHKYRSLRQNNVIYSQWAAITVSADYKKPDTYEYDVSFVGAYSPQRAWFLKELKKREISIQVFGSGWPTGAVTLDRMEEIFSNSRINLNLSNSTTYDLRYIQTQLAHTRGFWSKLKLRVKLHKEIGVNQAFFPYESKFMGQIKGRNFEIPAFCGFQLTDYFPSIEDYYEIGKEITCYSNVDEAASLIKYFLENNDERERIRLSGYIRTRNEHTYSHRFADIFSTISKKN